MFRLLAFVFLISMNFKAAANSDTITLALHHNPPYSYTENTDKPKGVVIDILTPIAIELGLNLNVVQCPFARCIRLMRDNEVDIMGSLMRTPERERMLEFITPAYMALYSSFRFYSLAGADFTVSNYEDLQNKRIAVVRGAVYFPRFDNDRDVIKVATTSEGHALDMLTKGRVDLMLAVEQTTDQSLEAMQIPAGAVMKHPFQDQEPILGHLAFNQQFAQSEQAKKVAEAYRELVRTGQLNEIVSRYGLPPVTLN